MKTELLQEMRFGEFQKRMQTHVDEMVKDTNNLFVVDFDKGLLWQKYLASFPEGTNPIYRTKTEHDCSCCRHFIRDFGNVVSIKNNKITTIWDFKLPEDSRDYISKARCKSSEYVRSRFE
jgi:hypothetical protein